MKQFFSLLVALSLLATAAHAAEPPASVNQMLNTLLISIEKNDIKSFHSVCNETMTLAMSPELLSKVSAQVGKPLAAGYTKTYWGDVNRPEGMMGYYWKLHFESKPDHDLVAELWVVDGKVAGFYLR
ncbi:hypothetical protein [Cerasicoccus maritimus]|uniref:hypothetical protein n=1 Tax=Cerasicoccus maritimus TaxID=490089 RepID=UPI0028527345|nr:hypothetical protein [Cerasicoccus maritimus]